MSKKTFEKGDLIFAKVRGYPAWPARVESQIGSPNPKNARYKVFFYGTYQTAVCKAEEVFPFEESKVKMGTPKKHKLFNEAMHEIESRPNIGAPVSKDSPPSSPEQVLSSEDEGDKPPQEKAPIIISHSKTEKTAVKRSRSTLSPAETPNKKVKASIEPDTPSRIKNAKIETPSKKNARDVEQGDVQASLHRAKSGSSSKNKSPSKSKTPLIALKLPANLSDDEDQQYLYDDYDLHSSPEHSDIEPDDIKRQIIEATQSKEIIQVTMTRGQALDILNKEDVPLTIRNKVCNNLMSRFIVKHTKSKKEKLESKESKLEFLSEELKLMTTVCKLKNLLGCGKVGEISAALALLDELDCGKMQPLMLKKQPHFVHTISKLCRYTGCVEHWELGEECQKNFMTDASEMRDKASRIYQQIKNIFARPDDSHFLRWFWGEAMHLKKLMSSNEHFILMTQEPIVVDLESADKIEKEVPE